jgi:hypothetical protein
VTKRFYRVFWYRCQFCDTDTKVIYNDRFLGMDKPKDPCPDCPKSRPWIGDSYKTYCYENPVFILIWNEKEIQ